MLYVVITIAVGVLINSGIENGKQIIEHAFDVNNWEWNEIESKALLGAATGLAYGLGGLTSGMLKGTFAAIKGIIMA